MTEPAPKPAEICGLPSKKGSSTWVCINPRGSCRSQPHYFRNEKDL